jgi:DNA primase
MSGAFDQSAVDRVQQANSIIDVISEYVSLAKKGREMVGLCPFHEDHRPSMYVNETKQIFKCFACGAGGDVLKFVQMKENLTFPQAIERLAQRAGIELAPSRRPLTSDRPKEADPALLAKVNDWAARYFANCLADPVRGKSTMDYVTSRAINAESIKTWRLGFSPDLATGLAEAARKKGIPSSLLQAAGLVTAAGQDRFVNRLMFAITDVTGRVIGFGGRTLNGDGAKYVNSPATDLFDKSSCLYGLAQARKGIIDSQTAIVVEGYTDCIMAHQQGCTNVVATLGTSLTSKHGRILRRYAKKVVLLFDGDTAGEAASHRALDICLKERIDIQIATIPGGEDPCEFLAAHGREGFEQILGKAVDIFAFKWERLMDRFQSDDTLAGRRAAMEEFLQTIATSIWAGQMSVVDRGLVVNRLSAVLGIEGRQLDEDLRRRVAAVAKGPSRDNVQPQGLSESLGNGLSAMAQREVLEVLLNDPRLFQEVHGRITVNVFTVPLLRQVAESVFAWLEKAGSEISAKSPAQQILARTESVEIAEAISELALAGERKGNYPSRMDGALRMLTPAEQAYAGQTIISNPGRPAPVGNRHKLGMI